MQDIKFIIILYISFDYLLI